MFECLGNYLYCSSCFRASFCVSKSRLTRQREIKRQQNQDPSTEMTKCEVEEQRHGLYVVMPSGVDSSFKKWWRALEPSAPIVVRTPHARHSNAGEISHSAKTTFRKHFLEFVDCNSQPNSRSTDSHGPTYCFGLQFSTVQMPKKGVSHYQE